MTSITKDDIHKLGTATALSITVAVPNYKCFGVMPLRDWSPVLSGKEEEH